MRDPIGWLLKLDPSLEYQIAREITGESADVLQMLRARIAHAGSGRALLNAQREHGSWAADEPTGWAVSRQFGRGSTALSFAVPLSMTRRPREVHTRRNLFDKLLPEGNARP